MHAYNFKAQFAPAVERGDKPLTLRNERASPSRHAQTGEVVSLWTGLRTPQARRLRLGVCTARATVLLTPAGVAAFERLVVLSPYDALTRRLSEWAGLGPTLCSAWADDFAKLDGFDNWAQAWGWHAAAAGAPPKGAPLDRLRKELVVWRPVPREAEAEVLGAPSLEDAA